MAKGTILDRLAGAMKTLGKREGKALTPKQRVAAAQRWNSLADIGEYAKERIYDTGESDEFTDFVQGMRNLGLKSNGWDVRADNPFLSDNIDKYREQSDFLEWCRYKGVEPNGQALKQFRWETYKTLPYRERQWIANKNDIRQALRDEGFVSPYSDDLRTLRDVDDAALDYTGSKYDFMRLPVYESPEEFPDDFDYMWRY